MNGICSKRIFYRVVTLFVLAGSLSATEFRTKAIDPYCIEPSTLTTIEHTVRQDELLSSLLLRQGIDGRLGPYFLYGHAAWVNFHKDINDHVKDWRAVKPGTKIILKLPRKDIRLLPKCGGKADTTLDATDVDIPPVDGSNATDAEEPVTEPIPDTSDIESEHLAVEPEIEEETPGIDFIGIARDMFTVGFESGFASGFLGMRVGHSLVRSGEKYITDSMLYSLVFESRGGLFDGLRFYWDIVPTVKDQTSDGQTIKIGWQRFNLSYAWMVFSWGPFRSVYLEPKIGRYTIDSSLEVSRVGNTSRIENIKIIGGLSLGYEVRTEFILPPLLLVPWFGQDISGAVIGLNTTDSIFSTKVGLDAIYTAHEFVTHGIKLNYLVFVMNERITIEGENNNNGDYQLKMHTPYAGLGTLISW